MLKEYMQRSGAAATAVSAPDYSQIEEKSYAACERLPCLLAHQQARHQPAHADGIKCDLSSSIAQAVQVVCRLCCCQLEFVCIHHSVLFSCITNPFKG